MGTYTHTPRTWQEAHAVANSPHARRGRDRKLGHETWLSRREERYVIRHWDTDVVTFVEDGSIILDAAKVSHTTAERMNTFTPTTITIAARGVHTDEPHYVIKTPTGTRLLFEGETTTLLGDVDDLPPLPQRVSKRPADPEKAR